ncbi:hypothetical protein F5Y15DRAFT_162861 [Xylariaceae sp. FL0016]|nr:hypothetical protein F5Y15DRAFT_162861 [Xylariaceae sp. FL0016]
MLESCSGWVPVFGILTSRLADVVLARHLRNMREIIRLIKHKPSGLGCRSFTQVTSLQKMISTIYIKYQATLLFNITYAGDSSARIPNACCADAGGPIASTKLAKSFPVQPSLVAAARYCEMASQLGSTTHDGFTRETVTGLRGIAIIALPSVKD